eukprot:739797-Hanusia_phi.AAC.1
MAAMLRGPSASPSFSSSPYIYNFPGTGPHPSQEQDRGILKISPPLTVSKRKASDRPALVKVPGLARRVWSAIFTGSIVASGSMPDLAEWRRGAAVLTGAMTVVMVIVAMGGGAGGTGQGSNTDVLMMRPVGYGIDAKTAVYDDEDIISDIMGAKQKSQEGQTARSRHSIPQNILARFAEDRAAFGASATSKQSSMRVPRLVSLMTCLGRSSATELACAGANGGGMPNTWSLLTRFKDTSSLKHVISALQDHVDDVAQSQPPHMAGQESEVADVQRELVEVKEREDRKVPTPLLLLAPHSLEPPDQTAGQDGGQPGGGGSGSVEQCRVSSRAVRFFGEQGAEEWGGGG